LFNYRNGNEEDDDNASYTLTFNIEFRNDNDTVYFAHCYPYTYSELQVKSLQKFPSKLKFKKILQCNPVQVGNPFN